MAIITKKVTVTTAGTRVPLGAEAGTIVELNVEAVATNADIADGARIHYGGEDVDSANEVGLSLDPQDVYSEDDDESRTKVAGRKMEDLYVDSTEDGASVSVFARTRDN